MNLQDQWMAMLNRVCISRDWLALHSSPCSPGPAASQERYGHGSTIAAGRSMLLRLVAAGSGKALLIVLNPATAVGIAAEQLPQHPKPLSQADGRTTPTEIAGSLPKPANTLNTKQIQTEQQHKPAQHRPTTAAAVLR